MAKKKTTKSESKPRRQRRTAEQTIADLEAKIVAIRQREAQKQAKADPALRHAATAMKAVTKALEAVENPATKKSLNQAWTALAECLDQSGAIQPASRSPRGRSSANSAELSDALLAYVRNNPGQRGEQIAAALETDSGTLRPVMKRLIAEGKVETEGQKRGMTYSVV